MQGHWAQSRYALSAKLFVHLLDSFCPTSGNDFILHEVSKGRDAARVAQLFWIGQKNGNFRIFKLRQNADEIGKIMGDVIGQNSNPKVINDALQYPEIVVDGQCGFWTVSHQTLHQCGADQPLGARLDFGISNDDLRYLPEFAVCRGI